MQFTVYWVCLTGTGIGQWRIVEEVYPTEEQARAVLDGHGPRPRAWWNVAILKGMPEKLRSTLHWTERKRKDALAELVTQAVEHVGL